MFYWKYFSFLIPPPSPLILLYVSCRQLVVQRTGVMCHQPSRRADTCLTSVRFISKAVCARRDKRCSNLNPVIRPVTSRGPNKARRNGEKVQGAIRFHSSALPGSSTIRRRAINGWRMANQRTTTVLPLHHNAVIFRHGLVLRDRLTVNASP
jgi:hypothetical protein